MLVFEDSGFPPDLRLTFEVHIHVYRLSLPTFVPQCSPSLSFQDFDFDPFLSKKYYFDWPKPPVSLCFLLKP